VDAGLCGHLRRAGRAARGSPRRPVGPLSG
jgi:hypothetical protein